MNLVEVHTRLVGTKPTSLQAELYTAKGKYRGWRSNDLNLDQLQAVFVLAYFQASYSTSTIFITPVHKRWVGANLETMMKDFIKADPVAQRTLMRVRVMNPPFERAPREPWVAFGMGGVCFVPPWLLPRLIPGA
jgi:hypothetical protein